MADEQYIYLSADEDVTSVRERLQKIPNRHIVLVVPSETQLRSHISWRLLHSSARDLGKDVLIISADRQIRSVVKAAGFKAADQQGSPSATKSRGSSNPGRFGLGGKTSPRLQTPPVKGSAPQQSTPPVMGNRGQQRTPPVKGKMPIQDSPPVQGSRPIPDTNVPRSAEPWAPQNDQMAQQYDNRSWPQQDSTTTGGIRPPFSSTFDPDEYSLGPASLIHPLAPTYEDEEPDLFLEDFHHAQSLREAAQTQDANTAIPSSEHTVPPQGAPIITDLSTTPGEIDDPLSHMTDDHPASLPEQRGSVIYYEPGEDVHDIADESTAVLHIEDLGDNDDEFFHRTASTTLDMSGESLEEEQDIPGPPRVHGVRPRTSRTGSMRPSQSRPLDLAAEDVKLPPPVYDQRSRFLPHGGVAADHPSPYPVMGSAYRQPPVMPSSPPVQGKPRPTGVPVAKAPQSRTAPKPTAPPTTKQKKKDNANFGLGIVGLLSVLVFFMIGLLAFLGPSADVTITLQSHNYNLQLELTATATSHLDALHHTVPAQTLPYDTSASGTGHATGTATVGTVQATGTVLFTNNSVSSVVVPNGTILSTKNNLQFVTQAEVLVLSGSSNTNVAPVQAQVAGTGGNLPAGSITVIPQEGLTKIQLANPSLANINLSVTNQAPTTGGGAGSATAVTNQDVTALKQQLDLQLQANVNAFIKKHVQPGDQQGKIVQVESPPATVPQVGSITVTSTFLMTLKLHISVLVVKAATIQQASIAEMNAALSKQVNGLALIPQQKIVVTKIANKSSNDGKLIVLNFTAVGQVAPQVSEETVRQLVSGKSVADAKYALKNTSSGGIPDVVDVNITFSPAFVTWVTFYTPHINVHFNAVPKPPKKK